MLMNIYAADALVTDCQTGVNVATSALVFCMYLILAPIANVQTYLLTYLLTGTGCLG